MKVDLEHLKLRDLKPNERVITIAWKHWFVLLTEIAGIVLLFFAPFILIPFALSIFAQQGVAVTTSANVFVFFGSMWALILWQVLFTRWTDYYYDIWIVTNWRIVDIQQKGLFKRNITSILDLDHIQDIDTEIEGIIKTILNFGDIEVQTAGTKNEFRFNNISDPRAIEKMIRDAQTNLLKIKQAEGHITTGIH